MLRRNITDDITETLIREAQTQNQRRVIVFSGELIWCQQQAQQISALNHYQQILWISEQEQTVENQQIISQKQVHALLGQETEALIFDAHSGFDPDAFAAVCGTLRGGGLLTLLVPPLAQWPSLPDSENSRITVHPYPADSLSSRFIQRLIQIIKTSATSREIRLIEQHQTIEPAVTLPATQSSITSSTAEQEQAIAAVTKVISGHRRRPLVLTSDRGRGKSSALGIAAARLLSDTDCQHIVLTGPQPAAVQQIFIHAQRLLVNAVKSGLSLKSAGKIIEFIAPDELLRSSKTADLLLVDEAAAIPTPLLAQLLQRYSRIAFATTVHGYEGSGRGFALRFKKILDQQTPGWKALTLSQPIRWAVGDPLESFVSRALLLDATPADDEKIAAVEPEHCSIERIDRDQVVAEEHLLTQLFGLLVLAHYRTRPFDLRHLLDGPNLEIYLMRYQGNVVATALVAHEGNLDEELARKIYQGYRRLQGHLITQALVAQLGQPAAAPLKGARIMRIAVHPILQRRGLGARLLTEISRQTQQRGFAWIGASFGATDELLRFWLQAGHWPIRIGFTREASSGEHSVIVLKPFSEPAHQVFTQARQRFLDSLPHLLSDLLQDLEPDLVLLLMRRQKPLKIKFNEDEWQELRAFACHQRNYEDSIELIWRLVSHVLSNTDTDQSLEANIRALLVSKVLQKKSWQKATQQAGLRGRKSAIKVLRQALQLLVADQLGH